MAWSLIPALALTAFASCSSDNNDEPEPTKDLKKEFTDNFFTIENGTFSQNQMPAGNPDGEPIYGLDLNDQALTGGMNFVTIQTPQVFDKFLLGVKGETGYWTIDAQNQAQAATDRASINTYIIPINFGTQFNTNIIIIIIAIDNNGEATQPTEEEIGYVESKSGDLNINLTFSNAKDIDLHLLTPSGREIYYANRGYQFYDEDGNFIENGLDHDSNAACAIDNLNNENIFIPSQLIEAGEYTVKVNMYSNCDPSIATYWSIVARYKGEIVRPTYGANPATGVYEAYCGNGDHTTVMKFTLKDAPSQAYGKYRAAEFKPLPLTESARKKLAAL